MKEALWIICFVIVLGVGAVAGHESHAGSDSEADQQDAEAIASRDWAAREVCQGRPFTWEDDKTLVCHREVP